MINILFTSAGRRIELIQEFIKARESKGIWQKTIKHSSIKGFNVLELEKIYSFLA